MVEQNEPTPPDETPTKPARGLFGRTKSAPPTPPSEPAPDLRRERPRRPIVNFFSGALTLVMVLALALGAALFVGKVQFHAPGPLQAEKVVMVKGGVADVADQLQREGVIEHPMLFITGLQVLGKSSQIKAGEYLFKEHASLNDVADTLVEGKAILHTLTIPEGLTSLQIVERLRENDVLVGDILDIPREGALLPETYKFSRGMTRAQLVERMQQEQAKVLREVWAKKSADLPIRSPQELVVLASIVEKETGRADERPRVAGVFVNRLVKNMKLQSDPTIVYGLVGGKGTLGRGLLKSEIDQATPYNTYVIPGLPPGPIANPGRAALEAVANPSRTRELYFVADGTGGHVFAETLDQHSKNVVRWRQIEGEKKDVTPTAADDPAANGKKTDAGGPANGRTTPLGPRGNLDAVAGTPKDPLLNKSFDLNSPKTVPQLKP
ncbi:endolytic transglycosylase MltG [Alsobacter sp. SYSU M60028]|uniref:Endolytic murein transglycosylase n=1 Tax=Alsobacter ponti TaxID=2962936 RepID=A0ABT1LFI8_9HYPH|nr:endolytic transglycosylase MltG [Alsobacter ponti]MCP8940260.1 endolytic transglycosylase MltG [Alsobacter ponti]